MIAIQSPALPSLKPYVVAGVHVSPGDAVVVGQELFNVETDKRAATVKASVNGIVAAVFVEEGDKITAKSILAEIEELDEAAPAEPAPEASALQDAGEANEDGDHAELLIIGGGTGGYTAAIYAAKHGKRVTLVERDRLGGTCLNRGCIPTKALISSAEMCHAIRHSSAWGIEVEGAVRPKMEAIAQQKDEVVDGLVEGIGYLMDKNGIRVLRGTARFDGNGTVVVSSDEKRRLTYDDCIIATGSTIRPLAIPGADLPEVMNTDEALSCTNLPASIAIVGGGVTGVEFAFLFSNLGADVTLIARRSRLLHTFDADVSTAIEQSAHEHGIEVVLGGDVQGFRRTPDSLIETTFSTDGVAQNVASERVLVAGGRIPQTDGLGLETTGIAVEEHTGAVKVDERMRTNVPHVYAVGDVNGLVMLAHAASYQGRIAVDDILGNPTSFKRNVIPSVAYASPEAATVGIGIDEARSKPDEYTVGSFDFAHNGKALAERIRFTGL